MTTEDWQMLSVIIFLPIIIAWGMTSIVMTPLGHKRLVRRFTGRLSVCYPGQTYKLPWPLATMSEPIPDDPLSDY